ncbi:hypothetical protein MGN70_007139 [Eutypa lata]|nr:hypothetical protein MGN70_007139 [Eutypa lata]
MASNNQGVPGINASGQQDQQSIGGRLAIIKAHMMLPARYVLTSTNAIRQKWSQLGDDEKERFCHLCGLVSSSKSTKTQHAKESHVGKRCHFPMGNNICGHVFSTEAELVRHLDVHMLPAEVEDGKFLCGWERDSDCANRRNRTGFGMQQSMLRHARKHQAQRARAAGDVVDRPYTAGN